MRLTTGKFFGLGIALCACVVGFALTACGDSGETPPNFVCESTIDCPTGYACDIKGVCQQVTKTCQVNEDCECGFVCDTADFAGYCVPDSQACVNCATVSDCPANYSCYMPDGAAVGWCIADAVDGDKDGDTEDDTEEAGCSASNPCAIDVSCAGGGLQICIEATHTCECKYPNCPNGTECRSGQTCNTETHVCEDTVVEDGDADSETEAATCDNGEKVCSTSSDCTDGKICGPGGCCKVGCSSNGDCALNQICNANNGLCEYCGSLEGTEQCSAGNCCNYTSGYWYCGNCCTPACGDGEACQGGVCQPLTACPTCQEGMMCDAEHGYSCYPEPVIVDGDVDTEKGAVACKAANVKCREGIDVCCSGTCLMGTCL